MAKKDKKKGKKQAGDWSDDEPVSNPLSPAIPAADEEEEEPQYKPTSAAARFANFSSFVDDDAGDDDGEDDGGLMATIRSTENKKKSKKDRKKAKKGAVDEEEDNGDGVDGEADPEPAVLKTAPIQMTADDLIDEEFGPTKPKGKGKKGKKGKAQQPDIDDDEFLNQQIQSLSVKEELPKVVANEAPKQEANESALPATEASADVDDHDSKGVLSKKEKERLKKEKEKAKKKAQAAAKKSASGEGAAQAEPADGPSEASKPDAADAAEDGEEDEETGAASKNKKKKKKTAAAKAEEAAAAAAKPAAGKKVPAHIAALQAALAKQKAEAEEARRREEEERRRIAEEEAREAELERQKEEEKRRKKEKERAKIEQLKKEGKYMTPKQKAAEAAAKARRDVMIASGQIKVEGLEADDKAEEAVAAPKTKKPTYGKKKPKKAGTGGLAIPDIISPGTATPPAPDSPIVEEPSIVDDPTRTEAHEPADVKDDWDAASEPETKPEAAPAQEEDELDDWDAASEPEQAESDFKQVANKVETKATPSVKKAEPVKRVEEAKKLHANGSASKPSPTPAQTKASPVITKNAVEESSEEEDEDDDDNDDGDSEDASESDSDSDDDDSDSDTDSDEERISAAKKQVAQRKAEAAARRQQKREEAIAAGSKDDLRSPICCILGHVDTGKTKILDKIRQSNVQEGEAGGITQQIGATYFPTEVIKQKTAPLGDANLKEYKLPGLLVIDTPGHESFTNLRTRGSSLCNIAILVVDIMHGLEPQTLESIRLLRTGKTPFIVALNKIDRLYGWEATENGAFRDSLAKQSKAVKNEFEKRLGEAKVAFAEQGLNAVPYYENDNFSKNVSLVPTSAHTGEGIADLLMLVTKLTQERMSSQLMYITELECTVLEVKVIEGLGTTLDVVLVNGVLHEGDGIVICGLNGPIVTQIRALLTPQPLKELRVRGSYVHHQMIKAAMGIKIVAPDLEKAIAGSRLLVIGEDDDEEEMKEAVMEDLQSLASSVDKSGRGVYVQASTLGSLEALLEFLKQSKIPVSNINIGPVHKKDVTRCAAMLDKSPELAVILAFDVPVDKDAERLADENNIKIFKADIIYHLFDDFTKHNAAILEAKRKDAAPTAVWPCKLKILKCFAKRDPIILGCDIVEGSTLRVGTPLAVVKVDPETKKKVIIKLGKVTSLEINHKAMDVVKRSQVGAGVAVKIEHAVYESAKLFGRHFNEHDELVSLISRTSIDALKTHFKEQVDKDDWVLIAKKLKPLLDIA